MSRPRVQEQPLVLDLDGLPRRCRVRMPWGVPYLLASLLFTLGAHGVVRWAFGDVGRGVGAVAAVLAVLGVVG